MIDTVDLLRAIGIILVVCIVLLAILIYRSVNDMIDTVLSDEEEEVSEVYGRVWVLAVEARKLKEKEAKSS